MDLAVQLLLLFRQQLPLPDALPLAFLNLVDDYGCALALGLLADNLALLSNLKSLEAFNLHHDVKALLLLNPLALELLVFLQLLVTDRNDFRVEHHLIHVLYVVMLLVELHLGLGQESLISFACQDLLFGRWQLGCPLAIHLHHTLLACFGRCLLLLKLLAVKLFGLGFIVLGLDFGGTLHTLDLSVVDDVRSAGWLLLCFLTDPSQILNRYDCNLCVILVGSGLVLG